MIGQLLQQNMFGGSLKRQKNVVLALDFRKMSALMDSKS